MFTSIVFVTYLLKSKLLFILTELKPIGLLHISLELIIIKVLRKDILDSVESLIYPLFNISVINSFILLLADS